MPFSTIDKSSDYFRIKLYTGNGSTQSITFDESKAMQPDCTWIKVRNDANVTLVHDVIRGATKEIYTPLTNAEATDANGLTAFNSNGFSVGSAFGVNRSGYNFVNWSWKANGTGVSNTNGSITSTVSANTTSGFSIVSFTSQSSGSATIGHGLGVAPKFIITKLRDSADNWRVYHSSLGNTNHLRLNLTDAVQSAPNSWNSTSPTSTVFTLGTTFAGSYNMIAYCFAEVKGFSKAFSYTGNGSTDGAFCHLGFKPAFVISKGSTLASSWNIHDDKRQTFNDGSIPYFKANTSDAELSATNMDFLSNGFKLRTADNDWNGSGQTYIGIAFATNPFVSSKGIPACAV